MLKPPRLQGKEGRRQGAAGAVGGNSHKPVQKGVFRKLGFRVSKIRSPLERVVREMQVRAIGGITFINIVILFVLLLFFLVQCFFHIIWLHTDTGVGFGKLASRLMSPSGLR